MPEITAGRLSAPQAPDPQFADDVQYYLSLQPRQLPSRYFYDDLGSAIFEAICRLPWYQVTRAEERLLDTHAREIFELAGRPAHLVELGSGSGEKLARLIERGWAASGRLDVELVDVSGSALDAARHRLSTIEGVRVVDAPGLVSAGPDLVVHVVRSAHADVDALPRFQSRQLRSTGRGSVPAQRPGGADARRCVSHRHRSGEARGRSASRLRRSAGCDRRVQPQSARAREPRAWRRFRSRRISAIVRSGTRKNRASRCTWSARAVSACASRERTST